MRYARRGQPLCSGEPRYRLALVAFKSDLQYDKLTFKFNSYDQNACCKDCKAHKTQEGLLYTQIGPNAAWRGHPRTTAEYLAQQNADMQGLVSIPGWCLELHRGDPMHLLFLGIGRRCPLPPRPLPLPHLAR